MTMRNSAALINKVVNPPPFDHHHLRLAAASLFHSTPVLDRRKRNNWDYERASQRRSNYYSSRSRRLNRRQQMLRNIGEFADNYFEGHGLDDEYDPSSSRGSSWFRCHHGSGESSRSRNRKSHQTGGRKGFQFCEDDFDVESIFRSAFGGGNTFFWSFINEEPRRSSSGYYKRYQTSWKRRNESDYDSDSSADSDSAETDMTSDRLALGLRGSGPLSLEDVKSAYRACALKWHPDRHEGSSKAFAEEKFKACSAAYQSICHKLAVN